MCTTIRNLIVLIMTVALLSSCSGSPGIQPSNEGEPPPQSPKPSATNIAQTGSPVTTVPSQPLTTIKVYLPSDPFFDEVISAFHKKYPSYRVEIIGQAPGNAFTDPQFLREQLTTGNFDLVWFEPRSMGFMIEENLLLPLDPHINRTQFNLAPFGPAVDSLRIQGTLYDLPIKMVPQVIFFNQNKWRVANLALPIDWTWDQFREAAQKLTSGSGDTKSWGFSTPSPYSLVDLWIYQKKGVRVYEAELADLKEAIQFFATMIFGDQTIRPDPLLNRPGWRAPQEFFQGQAAMYLGSLYSMRSLSSQTNFGWNMAPLPTVSGGRPAAIVNPVTLAISANSRVPAAAWDFLHFVAGEEGALAFVTMGQLPMFLNDQIRRAWFDRQPAPPDGTRFLFETTWIIEDRSYLTAGSSGQPSLAVAEMISNSLSGRRPWEEVFEEFARSRR